MGSYLEGSYLADGEDFDADGATTPLTQAPGEYLGDDAVANAPVTSDVIVLPGGIVIPKKTLATIALAIIVAVAVVYVMRRRDRAHVVDEDAEELVEA